MCAPLVARRNLRKALYMSVCFSFVACPLSSAPPPVVAVATVSPSSRIAHPTHLHLYTYTYYASFLCKEQVRSENTYCHFNSPALDKPIPQHQFYFHLPFFLFPIRTCFAPTKIMKLILNLHSFFQFFTLTFKSYSIYKYFYKNLNCTSHFDQYEKHEFYFYLKKM